MIYHYTDDKLEMNEFNFSLVQNKYTIACVERLTLCVLKINLRKHELLLSQRRQSILVTLKQGLV
jgi:hypothetical protein